MPFRSTGSTHTHKILQPAAPIPMPIAADHIWKKLFHFYWDVQREPLQRERKIPAITNRYNQIINFPNIKKQPHLSPVTHAHLRP